MEKADSDIIDIRQYADLVAALYRGPLQDSPWKDFSDALRVVFQPCMTAVGLRLPRPGDAGITFVGGHDLSPEDHWEYANKFSALDPLVNLPEGKVVALDDVISRQELHRTTYYRTFMKPFNQAQVIGLNIHRHGQVALFLRLMRKHGEPDFSHRDRAVLEMLEPQLVELANWIDSRQDFLRLQALYEQAFSSLAIATVILDRELKVVHINSVAEQLLAIEDSGIICVSSKLRVTKSRESLQFQDALQNVLLQEKEGVPQVVVMPRNGKSAPLLITLKKLPATEKLESSHHIAIYMIAPEMRELNQVQLVSDVFGLTPQEARLVIALANGKTLDDFVDEVNIRKNTARSHLYSAFQKIGVSQQSALVSRVIRTIYGL